MIYKLSKVDDLWIVAVKRYGSYHTPSLDDALAFIRQHIAWREESELIAKG